MSSAKTEYSAKEKERIAEMKKGYSVQMPIVFAILGVIGYALYGGHLNFAAYQGIKVESLKPLTARLQYVLRHATPGVLWFLFCLGYVGSKRSNSPAMDPTRTDYEHLVVAAKNIFNNSVEQFLLSIFSQLILVTYLEPRVLVNVIPVMNIMYIVGRVLFWAGYPNRRGIGFGLTFWPSLIALVYISYRYVLLYL